MTTIILIILVLAFDIAAQDTFITIETKLKGEMEYFSFSGNGTATIDWGDGSVIDTVKIYPMSKTIEKSEALRGKGIAPPAYTKADRKTITVTGNITELFVGTGLP
jgi:hypothetical protein